MSTQHNVRFLVLDAADAPGDGQILRLRLESGETSLKALKGARLDARGPDGSAARVRVKSFALVGGKPSESRFARSGRVDVVVVPDEGDSRARVGLQWEVVPAR